MKLLKAWRVLQERPGTAILISTDREVRCLKTSEILYVEVADHRLIFHTSLEHYSTFGTLQNTENILGKSFARCSKSFLVNLQYVDSIQGNQVALGTDLLSISRSKRKAFLQALSDYCRYGGR